MSDYGQYVAHLTPVEKQKVKQLEQELGVILIAYDQSAQRVSNLDEQPDVEHLTSVEYLDDPNLNLL
ncbi:hypothetical protein [Caldalkalibacillus salinus]|uniref:hypothetical protein n=1 Tax=Caldalkalibacillus salinus TaxID=2803787 RepID=UPI001920E6D4|nr:hypothetical protein [Caldalkalibacillus salinus]